MSGFESFPQPARQEATPTQEVVAQTLEDLSQMLITEWEGHAQFKNDPERVAHADNDDDLDAVNTAMEHQDETSEDGVLESWQDNVPDEVKPQVAAIIRQTAPPELVALLDKFSSKFRES